MVRHERRICLGAWEFGFPENSGDGKLFCLEKARKSMPETAMAVAKTTPCEQRIEDIFLCRQVEEEKKTEEKVFGEGEKEGGA